jgi:hypothetical protein
MNTRQEFHIHCLISQIDRASLRLSQSMWLQGCTIWGTPVLCHIYSVCKLLHLCIVSSGIHVSSTYKIAFAWGADMF